MNEQLNAWLDRLQANSTMGTVVACVSLLVAAWLTNFLVKRIIVRAFLRMARAQKLGVEAQVRNSGIIRRLANICPALVLILGVRLIPDLPPMLVQVVANVGAAFIILSAAIALGLLMDITLTVYNRRPNAHLRPIKGYLQVVKIAIYILAAVLIVAALVDRSPLILLSGLGAMAAVLMLIFQDTLLSLVASVQISSNDIVRVDDWIEMPQLNADGFVIDIALHTVKVQNWDKTITTIPTKRLITESFKNWRGMQQSGGRRIKRSLFLDQQSIHFLDETEREYLARFRLLEGYLHDKLTE
ncbi:MAG TPA: mechanosensitive ion channel domain-containing protein, partial [Hyphomicrobiales bacterium]|nr:mechanosensitive ion channel domain-containing protein [Hyphomicrobiales bacterium]